MNEIVSIENKIFIIRGQRVMLDSDLAKLYGIETFNLNKAVKRNLQRFPADFMFQLTKEEYKTLVFQNGISKPQKGGRRFMPYVFTEQGVAMLSSVLNSDRAITINVEIMRAFVRLRQYALAQSSKNSEIEELRKMLLLHIENTDNKLEEHEETIQQIITVLNSLIEKPRETKQIGFAT